MTLGSRGTAAIAALLVAAVAPAAAEPAFPRAVAELVGAPAPELRARLLADRSPVDLEALRGRPALLVFYATWCRTCHRLEPTLEALERDLGPRGLTVLALSHERRATLLSHRAQRPVGYTVAQCTGRTALRYAAQAVPTLILIDAAGTVRGAWQGSAPRDLRALRRAAEALLPAPPRARPPAPSDAGR
jgi:thiol-disulfide isomerase/thioredoxin